MAGEKAVATEQELREALVELTRTGRAAIDSGVECTFEWGGQGKGWMIPRPLIVTFGVILRRAEVLLREKGE